MGGQVSRTRGSNAPTLARPACEGLGRARHKRRGIVSRISPQARHSPGRSRSCLSWGRSPATAGISTSPARMGRAPR